MLLGGEVDESATNRVLHKFGSLVQVQLAHKACSVYLHRIDADHQTLSDIAIGVALGDKVEHLALPRREAVIALPLVARTDAPQVIVQELACHSGIEVGI